METKRGGVIKIKIVLVGDERIGKSTLLQALGKGSIFNFSDKYDPTVAENYEIDLQYEGKPFILNIWDLGGK